MEAVFVAGSRAVSRLTPEVRRRLDNIVEKNFFVFVGDANGVDKAVQRYLADRQYRNVIVYCMEACRNNVGHWPTRSQAAEAATKRDRHYYGIKDAAMAKDSTLGLMLWDGASKGTLANIVNLLNQNKKVALYLSPVKRFFNLHNVNDFDEALNANGINDISRFFRSMGVQEPASHRLPLVAGSTATH